MLMLFCRWRYAKEPGSGELTCDEFGEKIRETNAKVIRWSDGKSPNSPFCV